MAVKIHENFYQGLRCLMGGNDSFKPSFVGIDGTTFNDYYFIKIVGSSNGGFSNTTSPNYWTMIVGKGERTSDADYKLGSQLSNIGHVSASAAQTYNDTSKVISMTLVATGKNNNSEQITVTEVGLLGYANTMSRKILCAYEHLESPIVVEPGAYFTVLMIIEIQT